jgi:hypothetical protein
MPAEGLLSESFLAVADVGDSFLLWAGGVIALEVYDQYKG